MTTSQEQHWQLARPTGCWAWTGPARLGGLCSAEPSWARGTRRAWPARAWGGGAGAL